MLKLSDVIAAQQRKINEMREEYDVLNQVSLSYTLFLCFSLNA